jgi:hypothetical protein
VSSSGVSNGAVRGVSTVVCMRIFVVSQGLAFGGEVQGLSAGAVDGGLVVGGLVVAIAATGLVVFVGLVSCEV